jgi:hypothetical protein
MWTSATAVALLAAGGRCRGRLVQADIFVHGCARLCTAVHGCLVSAPCPQQALFRGMYATPLGGVSPAGDYKKQARITACLLMMAATCTLASVGALASLLLHLSFEGQTRHLFSG